MSLKEVERYTRAADARLAREAIASERSTVLKPLSGLQKNVG
jgi:hypothetical protein